jgi:hypothetical protein
MLQMPGQPDEALRDSQSAHQPQGLPIASGDIESQVLESPAEPVVVEWRNRASALQHLGAIEYELEKWGNSGRLYRFSCQVAVDGTRFYRRHFEAINEDGAKAVEEVVQRVRLWRRSATVAE